MTDDEYDYGELNKYFRIRSAYKRTSLIQMTVRLDDQRRMNHVQLVFSLRAVQRRYSQENNRFHDQSGKRQMHEIQHPEITGKRKNIHFAPGCYVRMNDCRRKRETR